MPYYKANNQQDYWENKTGIITGYAHVDKDQTYLASARMTTLPIKKCNQIMDDELERIKDCKLLYFSHK